MLLKYQCLFVLAVTVVLLVVIVILSPTSLLSLFMDDRIHNLVEIQSSTFLLSMPMESRIPLSWFATDYNRTLVESSLQKKGYSVTDLPPWSSLWTNKIHLCVMFNLRRIKPRKDIIDILVSYYYPFFENITLIFDGANWERPDFVPKFVNFISCDSHVGWYQQKCIRLCMQQGTEETKGYLYIADDMFINLTMMADLPTTKIWFTRTAPLNYLRILNQGYKWPWWPANAKKLEKIIKIFPSEWMEQLKKTAGFPDQFKIVATSDIIFVPQAITHNLTTVIDFIVEHTDLFCEIATCLAVDIAAPNQVVIFKHGYLWTPKERSVEGIEKTAKTAHFVHPVKLGVEQHRKLWIEYMEILLYNSISRS